MRYSKVAGSRIIEVKGKFYLVLVTGAGTFHQEVKKGLPKGAE